MKFEQGKTYRFSNKQFNIGRDNNNRLIFIIPDPSTGMEQKVLAFNYQNNNLPERIECIYNGLRLEQDPMSAARTLYKPGDVIRFYVNSDVRGGKCTLRDEQNDVTYKNVKIGKNNNLKRFDHVECRIDSTEGDKLSLTPLVAAPKGDSSFFTPDNLKEMPEGRYLRYDGLLDKILTDPECAEARCQLEQNDNSWVVTLLEDVLAWAVARIRERTMHKDYILPGVDSLAVALIERTDYVSKFPEDRQAEIQERLETVARNAGDYRRVYNLLVCHEVDSTMHSILGSLKKSTRFYQPEEKVRLLGAMLTLEAVDVNRYMEDVLAIIAEHHANETFMHYFKKGMLDILARFNSYRQKRIGKAERAELRLLIRSLATEQLLAAGCPDHEVERRRGFLYTSAAILINDCENALPLKAIQCFAGLVKASPEFSWLELNDIQRLCYAYLTKPFGVEDLKPSVAVYEDNGHVVQVSSDALTVASSANLADLKRTLSYPVAPGLTALFMTPDRISGFNADKCLDNPLYQREGFRDLLRLLRSSSNPQIPAERNDNLTLEVGDHVSVRVVGRRDALSFNCEIVDDVYKGQGVMSERDIVAYDITVRPEDFRMDGHDLVFEAVVKGILPDGTYQFTIRPSMNAFGMHQARYDFDSDTTVRCVITGTYRPGMGYFALSENGYPMVVWLPQHTDYELHRNDIVLATVVSVNSDNNNLFVKADYHDIIDPEEDSSSPAERLTVDSIFRKALHSIATGVYEQPDPDAVNQDNVPAEVHNEIELDVTAIALILRTVNGMTNIGRQLLGRRYALQSVCRMIAVVAGMQDVAQLYSVQSEVLEELGSFAVSARIDVANMRRLENEAAALSHRADTLDSSLELLRVLAGLDRPEEFPPCNYPANSLLSDTSNMVAAYNQLRGMSLDTARREILKGIYILLGLPQPQTIDVECLKVQEDERNEFKTSLIYPADNNMRADDLKQGRVIMEVIDGMLNHKGGVIYLGVNNQGVPVGLDNDFKYLNNGSDKYEIRDIEDKFSLHFHYYLRTQIGMTVNGLTLTDYVRLSYESMGGKVIGRITVEAFPGMVRMKDGKVFKRQDSSTIALPPSEQSAFMAHRIAKALEK